MTEKIFGDAGMYRARIGLGNKEGGRFMISDENCVFCKIVAGVVPADKVYEDDASVAFLDITPKAKGHTLLIPKDHYTWMQDSPDELVAKIFVVAKEIMGRMRRNLDVKFVKLSVVGTDIPHFHVHLIPVGSSATGLDEDKYDAHYRDDAEKQEYAAKIRG